MSAPLKGGEYLIIYRVNRSHPQYVSHDDGDFYVFADKKDAQDYADGNELFRSGQADYQIVRLDI